MNDPIDTSPKYLPRNQRTDWYRKTNSIISMYSTAVSIFYYKAVVRQDKSDLNMELCCQAVYSDKISTVTVMIPPIQQALIGWHTCEAYLLDWSKSWQDFPVTFLTLSALNYQLCQHLRYSRRQGTTFSCYWGRSVSVSMLYWTSLGMVTRWRKCKRLKRLCCWY